ncbi:MAG: hypothetical protein AB8B79_15755 [Granulosicoccus sp.]
MMPVSSLKLLVPRWCIYSVLLLASSPTISADDFMGDQRLFFTARERQNNIEVSSSVIDEGKSLSAKAKKRREQTMNSYRYGEKKKSVGQLALTSSIVFNGLVSDQYHVQILVNGKPCLPVSHARQNRLVKAIAISCPHLKTTSSSLQFHKIARQLIISNDEVILATLAPGEQN